MAGALLAVIALGAPAAASAVVYCVPNDAIGPIGGTPCDPGQGQPTIQAAFTAAQASTGVGDTVLIGQGSYNEVNPTYSSATPANVINVIGAGTGLTLLTIPDTTGNAVGLSISGPPGSSVSDLAMTIPANADGNGDRGVFLGPDMAGHDLLVDGPAANNAIGVRMSNNSTLADSVVNLPFTSPAGNQAVSTLSATTTINDSTLHGVVGVRHGGTLSQISTIQRSTIQASGQGVSEDSGFLVVRDSVIDLGTNNNTTGAQAANFNNGTSALSMVLTGVTIVGGSANSTGVHAQGDSDTTVPIDGADMNTDGEEANITVDNTVISGPTVPLRIQADRGERATISTSYSNYDTLPTVITSDLTPGGGIGEATLNESNRTNFTPPGFVSPGTGDYHLADTSPLIDIGDPAMSPPAERDIDGDMRDVFGKDGCDGARRDIGADEFIPLTPPTLLDCIPPDTTIASGPSGLISDSTPTFGFTSTESPATFECSLNGGPFTSCPATFTTPALLDAAYTLSVRSIDVSLNTDASPATRIFTVDTTAPDTTASGPAKLKLKKKKKKSASASYSLSTEAGATLECSLDGAAFSPCSSPHVLQLRKGTHTLSVRSSDAAGNVDASPATVATKVVKKKKKKK